MRVSPDAIVTTTENGFINFHKYNSQTSKKSETTKSDLSISDVQMEDPESSQDKKKSKKGGFKPY